MNGDNIRRNDDGTFYINGNKITGYNINSNSNREINAFLVGFITGMMFAVVTAFFTIL